MLEGFSFAVGAHGPTAPIGGGLPPGDAAALHAHARRLLDSDSPDDASGWWLTEKREWLRVWFERHGGPHERFVVATGAPERPPYDLTPRELDVLTLMCVGLTNPEIAGELVTSVRTVSTQVAAILGKLHQPTRAGATALATAQRTWRLPLPMRTPPEPLPLSPVEVRGHAQPFAPRAQRAPVRIGSVVPGHGPCASDGTAMARGAALAIAEINRRGGIAGRPVEHVPVTVDVLSATAPVDAFDRLLAADVDAITSGYFFAVEDERLWRLLGEIDVPVLHAKTSQRWVDRVADDPGRLGNVFHVCPSERGYFSTLAQALDTLASSTDWHPPNRRLALSGSYRVSGDAFEDTADALLARRWELERRSSSLDDSTLLDALAGDPPAVVLVIEPDPDVLARFLAAIARRVLPTLVYQLYTPSMPDYLRKAGPAAEGSLWSTVTGTYGDALGASFTARYRNSYGTSPGRSHAGIAYDEVCMLAAAWSAVSDVRARRLVTSRLRATPHRGVNGSYYFDHPGQHGLSWHHDTPDASLAQAHLVLQVQNGAHRIIWPPTYAEASFVLPPSFRTSPSTGG